jgi:hypothetical protein
MALGLPMAVLAGSALAGGGAALGGFFGRPKEQEFGFDVFKPDLFPGFEQLQGANIGFLQQELERIRKGEIPQALQGPADALRGSQQQLLNERTFGRPGDRSGSLFNRQLELGSILGTGPGATQAQGNKALQQFGSSSLQIDQFIDQLLLQGTTSANQFAVGAAQSQPSGPPQTVIPFGGNATNTGGVASGLASAGQAIGSGISGSGLLNSLFQPSTTAGTQTQAQTPFSLNIQPRQPLSLEPTFGLGPGQ